MRRVLFLAAAAATLVGCDAARPGIEAWRAGDPREALARFTDAVVDAGADASAELLYDRALAALATGELAVAEASADAAAVRGGGEFIARRDFVRGNTAFARSLSAEAEAKPGATAAIDRALAHAETAFRSWCAAAAARDDWPEARRNAERALLRVESLRARRGRPLPGLEKAALVRPRPLAGSDPNAPDPAPGSGKGEAKIDVAKSDLTAEDVRRLADVLAKKEAEKLAARRAARDRQPADVERDW